MANRERTVDGALCTKVDRGPWQWTTGNLVWQWLGGGAGLNLASRQRGELVFVPQAYARSLVEAVAKSREVEGGRNEVLDVQDKGEGGDQNPGNPAG